MEIVHLSDLHLGRSAAGDELGSERLGALRAAIAVLAGQSPDAVLVAGDVFDSPQVDRGVVQAAARALARWQNPDGKTPPVVVIPGNHDPSDAAGLWDVFQEALGPQSVVRLVLRPEVLRLCDGKLLVEAYPCQTRYSPEPPWSVRLEGGEEGEKGTVPICAKHPSGRSGKWGLSPFPPPADGVVRVVLAHGTLQGGPVPEGETEAYPFTLAEAEALGANYVALGHFHGVYPAWPGGEQAERSVSYCGTHEPDQFEGDAGWAIVATLVAGQPACLRRIAVGRAQWRQVVLAGPHEIERLEQLLDAVERDAEPGRFVIRVKLAAGLVLPPADLDRVERGLAGLRALGARVERQGEVQTLLQVETLDLAALPTGAVKEALLALRDEWEKAEGPRREVVTAAIQLGYGLCREKG